MASLYTLRRHAAKACRGPTFRTTPNGPIEPNHYDGYVAVIDTEHTLFIHFELGFIACARCHIGVLPNHVKGHLKKHAISLTNFHDDIAMVTNVNPSNPEDTRITGFLNHAATRPVSPFELLEIVVEACKCSICCHVFETKKGYRLHFKSAHQGETMLDPIVVNAQRLFKNPGLTRLFEVDENIDESSDDEVMMPASGNDNPAIPNSQVF